MYVLIRHQDERIVSYRCIEAKHAYPLSKHRTDDVADEQLLLVHQQYIDPDFYSTPQEYRVVDGELLHVTDLL